MRLLAALLSTVALPAAAQAPQALDPVVITATRVERALLDVPASIDVLTRDELRDMQWRTNLSEGLAGVAGLTILNRQNFAQDLQISVRGFGARSTFGVRGLRLYVDGIPASMPDGQGQVSHFPLSAVERIEVLRGPFSALYGNAAGGVIAMTTRLRPQPPEAEVALASGSFNTWRAGTSLIGGREPYAYMADVSRFSTDGYRQHSAARRDLATLRGAVNTTSFGAWRLTFNALDMPAQDPLGLTREQWLSDPRLAAPQALQFNTRKETSQRQLGTEWSHTLGAWQATAVAWGGTRDIVQFQAIPTAPQANPNHPGGVIDFERAFGGLEARVQRDVGPALATFGVSYERLNEDRRGYENFSGMQLGVRGALRRDERNTVDARDAYAQVEAPLSERWRVLAGVRASQVRFDSRDRYLLNGDDSGDARFNDWTPSVGAVYRWDADSSVYASYGRGFETPTLNELAYRSDGSAGLNADLSPAHSQHLEIGAKRLWSPQLRTTLALFAVNTRDEIVVEANAGGRSSFANAARTERRGIEFALQWQSGRWSIGASASALRAVFSETFFVCAAAPCTNPNVPVPAGNRLPGVPQLAAALDATWRAPLADVKLEWRGQSSLAVNDRNTDFAPGYGVVNLAVARSLNAEAGQARVFLRIDNVLDARYIGSVIVNEANGRFFEPAPGRSWSVGLDLRF